jgi:hypothetical protein
MGRRNRAGNRYVAPIDSAGAAPVAAVPGPRGQFTLSSGTTYLYILTAADPTRISAHVQWDAAVVITSITFEDTNVMRDEVSDFSTTNGDWIDEDPSTAFVGTQGAGVTVTNGVVAVAGGAVGGCMFHVADHGAARARLRVVVGGTGGVVRVATHDKE